MKKWAFLPLAAVMVVLILDSRSAARSAQDALQLCLQTLVPTLFPLFVFSAMVVPRLSTVRIPGVARLLGIPVGSEGLFLLGCAGGYPVGAACISQAVQAGTLDKKAAQRMLGLVTLCGPSFLFGVIGSVLSMGQALLLFIIQLEAALLTSQFHSDSAAVNFHPSEAPPVPIHDAMNRAMHSTAAVCGWVTLAGVVTGFLRRWFAPLLHSWSAVLLTGFLELTGGVFALHEIPDSSLQFILCAAFICFGGISVQLQITAFAGAAGLSMGPCIIQKAAQAVLGTLLAVGVLAWGPGFLVVGLLVPVLKIAVEISGRMVYNVPRKEGI